MRVKSRTGPSLRSDSAALKMNGALERRRGFALDTVRLGALLLESAGKGLDVGAGVGVRQAVMALVIESFCFG